MIINSFSSFLKHQESVYEQLRKTPDVLVPKKSEAWSYFVSFAFDKAFGSECVHVSEQITQIIPSRTKSLESLHTTIGLYNLSKDFLPKDEDVQKLCEAVAGIDLTLFSPEISYGEYLISQNSVLLSGYPNEDCYNLMQKVLHITSDLGFSIKQPWGTHITLNRFSSDGAVDRLKAFLDAQVVPEKAKPSALIIGYNVQKNETSSFVICKRLKI